MHRQTQAMGKERERERVKTGKNRRGQNFDGEPAGDSLRTGEKQVCLEEEEEEDGSL